MKLSANIWKLRWFYILNEFLIVIPVLGVFWLNNGLNMTQVFLLQSAFSVVIMLMEIPSGYFADRFGRKNALLVGAVAMFLGFGGYAFSYNFWNFLIMESVIALGFGFISGANSALLYDSLVEMKQEEKYQKFEGNFFALTGYAQAVAAIFGGMVAAVALRESFYAQAGILFLLIPLSLALREPRVKEFEITESKENILQIVKFSLKEHKEIKWLIIFSGIVLSSTLASVWFAQAYWLDLEVPLSWFGILWAVFALSRGVFAQFADWFEKKAGRKVVLISLVVSPVLGYFFLALSAGYIWSIAFFLFFQFSFAASTPIIKSYINQLVPSNIRATVLSIQSFAMRILFAVIGPFLGWSLDLWSFEISFYLSALLFFVLGGIALIFLQKNKVLAK